MKKPLTMTQLIARNLRRGNAMITRDVIKAHLAEERLPDKPVRKPRKPVRH